MPITASISALARSMSATLLDRGVAVGHRLRFHALGGIDDQQRALAGGQRAADFIGEVDVARGIDEVQVVGLPVLGQVRQRHRLRLDRDATLALDRVGVEHLRFHLTGLQATAELDDAVGQRGLAVVDMGNDGEVADGNGRLSHARRLAAKPASAGRPGTAEAPPGRGFGADGRRRSGPGRPYWPAFTATNALLPLPVRTSSITTSSFL
ncbi:hypothetical protein G6F50_013614 [Rhizopus delemar]|uniref:Uncharacterized protein n=1 Tax=Rhizopus delemar TaxID=936053 RepID=A0A9P6YES2_9FUNG|nr:hypothetical protein G6F50_013614 [Rhizopus delemar]